MANQEVDMKALERLRGVSVFERIKDNDEFLLRLMDVITYRKFGKGECIIREDEIGEDMYIMMEGEVSIEKKTRGGDSYTVSKLKAPQNVFFGELALIDDDKRSATVITMVDSEFLVLNKHDFIGLCEKYPVLGWNTIFSIAKMISSHLRKTSKDMLAIFDALVDEIDQ
ncbi:MAG: cyclic nucleotide-binding domain-containing protein [Bacteriovoracaceae bacterium]|nr:cyclic nucleotide-binding domain-containing protein [Bacteriovoracaceae bacterium]